MFNFFRAIFALFILFMVFHFLTNGKPLEEVALTAAGIAVSALVARLIGKSFD